MNQGKLKAPNRSNIISDEDDKFNSQKDLIFQGPVIKLEDFNSDMPTFVYKLHIIELEDIKYQVQNLKLPQNENAKYENLKILQKDISELLVKMRAELNEKKDNFAKNKNQISQYEQEIVQCNNDINKLKQQREAVKLGQEYVQKEQLVSNLTEINLRNQIRDNLLQASIVHLDNTKKWIQNVVDKLNSIGVKSEDAGIIEAEYKHFYKMKTIFQEKQNQCEEKQRQIEELNQVAQQQRTQIETVSKSLNQNYGKYLERLAVKDELVKQLLLKKESMVEYINSVPVQKITVGYDWYGINALIILLIFLIILFKQYY